MKSGSGCYFDLLSQNQVALRLYVLSSKNIYRKKHYVHFHIIGSQPPRPFLDQNPRSEGALCRDEKHTVMWITYCNSSSFSWTNPSGSAGQTLLSTPRFNRSWGDRSFAHSAPHLWDSLPENIRTSTSLDSFKRLVKTHLMTSFISTL